MKEKIRNIVIKNFTWWDAIVLLVLILILAPIALNVLMGLAEQNYTTFFVNLALSGLIAWGIVKYVKKLLAGFKNSNKKT